MANAPAIGASEAALLQKQQQHHPALQRRKLVERLALPADQLTPDLVNWGEKRAGAAERLALLLDPELAIQRDHKRLRATTRVSNERVTSALWQQPPLSRIP